MTVAEMAKALRLITICASEEALSGRVTGGYCGDLLSWIIGRAEKGQALITIMSNPNVAAVAELAELSCVILAENVSPDEKLRTRAAAEGFPLLSSPESSFALAGQLYALLQEKE